MPDLPRGWHMHNSTTTLSGLPIEASGFVARPPSDTSSVSTPLDIRPDSEGWEDAEDDTEVVSIKCLLCPQPSPTAEAMVAHCKAAHGFDFVQVQKKHGLDFYGSIKLVNYIRKSVRDYGGEHGIDVERKEAWEGDEYLAPVLEDDALLFSLDDLAEGTEKIGEENEQVVEKGAGVTG